MGLTSDQITMPSGPCSCSSSGGTQVIQLSEFLADDQGQAATATLSQIVAWTRDRTTPRVRPRRRSDELCGNDPDGHRPGADAGASWVLAVGWRREGAGRSYVTHCSVRGAGLAASRAITLARWVCRDLTFALSAVISASNLTASGGSGRGGSGVGV